VRQWNFFRIHGDLVLALIPTVNFLDIARAGFSRGLRQFVVLKPGNKIPIEDEWQKAPPIDDELKLTSLLKNHPNNCNCGAITSRQLNLILDFDDIVWLFDNWPTATWPETFVVKTGNAGLQMHFWQTNLSREKLSNAALKNPKKGAFSTNVMEVLFDRKQGLLPGCLHPNGRLYEVFKDKPLAPIPDYVVEWVLKLLDKKSPLVKPGQVRPIRPDLDVEGKLRDAGLKFTRMERDGKVYLNHHKDMGMCLVKGASHEGDGHKNKDNNRCCAFVIDPATGGFWYQCFAGSCEATPQKTKKALNALGLKLEDLLVERWRRFFDSRADFEKSGDLIWQVEGISYQGEITGNVALQKNGKSWLVMSKMRALLSGKDWMRRKVAKAARVIYFIPEVGRASVYRRLKAMQLDQYLDRTLFVRTSALGVPDLLNEEIMEACAGADVFMDTLIRFLDGPENNAEVIKEFAEKAFALLSVARNIEINAHTLKSYADRDEMGPEMFRGSGDITAFLSNGYGLMQTNAIRNEIFVKCLFSRDLPEDPPSFKLQGREENGDSIIDKEHDFRLVDADAGALSEHRTNPKLKNLTEEMEARLRELFPTHGFREIAEILGVKSHVTVSNWAKELGLKRKKDKQVEMKEKKVKATEEFVDAAIRKAVQVQAAEQKRRSDQIPDAVKERWKEKEIGGSDE